MTYIDHHCAKRFGHVYRFIDDLIQVKGNKEFDNPFKEIYSAELELKKVNASDNVANFCTYTSK